MSIVDLIIIILFALAMYKGAKRGLLKSFWLSLSNIISLVLSYILYPKLSFLISKSKFINSIIQSFVAKSLNAESGTLADGSRQLQREYIKNMNIPDFLKDALNENNNDAIKGILHASGFSDFLVNYISKFILNILSLILVYLLVKVIIRAISSGVNSFSNSNLLNAPDKGFGILYGFLQVLFAMWIVFLLMAIFMTSQTFDGLFDLIDNSFLASLIYNNNILFLLLFKLLKPA